MPPWQPEDSVGCAEVLTPGSYGQGCSRSVNPQHFSLLRAWPSVRCTCERSLLLDLGLPGDISAHLSVHTCTLFTHQQALRVSSGARSGCRLSQTPSLLSCGSQTSI